MGMVRRKNFSIKSILYIIIDSAPEAALLLAVLLAALFVESTFCAMAGLFW